MGRKDCRIRHIIWDWNGTLLDDAAACAAAVDKLMRRRGMMGETLEGYRSRVRFPVRDYYLQVGFDLEREDYNALCDEFGDAYAETILSAYPDGHRHEGMACSGIHADAVAVLEESGRLGVTHAIVSASEAGTLKRQVEEYGLTAYFSELVGRDDNHGGTKTHLVQAWVEKCGYGRDQILYIGDTEHDCEAALASGVRAALVSDGHVEELRLRRCRVPVFANRRALWQAVSAMTRQPGYRMLRFSTPLGEMGVVSDNLGIVQVDLPGAPVWHPSCGTLTEESDQLTVQAREAILAWFENPRCMPDIPLSISGTSFQRQVWAAAAETLPGAVSTYGTLAMRIGRPGAARAVAQALRANPVPILIPCHRVVGFDGAPVGYMGKRNNPLQQRLLEHERLVRTDQLV